MSHQETLLHSLHQQRTESHLCVLKSQWNDKRDKGLEGNVSQTLDRGRSQGGNTEQQRVWIDFRRREEKGAMKVSVVTLNGKEETMTYDK